jgi:phosphoribosylglycinamide formyltransferase-1
VADPARKRIPSRSDLKLLPIRLCPYDGVVDRIPIVVMASGSGSVLQSLLDASAGDSWPAKVVAVVTDRPKVGALARAASVGVPTAVVSPGDYSTRSEWDIALAQQVARWQPEWVVSAGFMRLLGESFLQTFPSRIVNTHPALLPAFPGAHGVADALAYGVKVSGCTVHLVDSGMDTGPVLAQQAVPVHSDDTEESLHERIKIVERRLLVDTVAALVRNGCVVDGRRVRFR